MAIQVLLGRSLPLPSSLVARGEPIRFVAPGETAQDAVAILTTALDGLDRASIAALPSSVGLIVTLGVGTDRIDLTAARERGICVANTPINADDTADLALALMLAATRRVAAADRFVRDGRWGVEPFAPGIRATGARLALAGFGAIGQAVARRARGFDMEVTYWARLPRSEAQSSGARFVASLDELMAGADILSLHLPLTDDTLHLIDAALLARAPRGLVLVNTGRGGLIEAQALIDALESGQVAAAGLDVFENEPSVPPALLAHDGVVLTPHIGAATTACHADLVRRGIANLVAFLETGEPLDRVV